MTGSLDIGRAKAALEPLMEFMRHQLRASTDVFLERAEKSLSQSWPEMHDPHKKDSTRYAANWLGRNRDTIRSALQQRLIGALSAEYSHRRRRCRSSR